MNRTESSINDDQRHDSIFLQEKTPQRSPASIFSGRSLLVDVLVICFSMGSWIGIKATFLEVPLLVEAAPEGWKLPSYFVAIVQIGNLGPVIYTALQKVRPIRDANMVHFVLALGTAATVGMAIWYKETAVVFGENHSIAMFIAFLGFSIVGCTSSVLFMPYMGRFREIYLITYFFGVDLSGLFTSIVVIIQGVGGTPKCVLVNDTADPPIYEAYFTPPRFGVSTLFYFVLSLMVLSIVAFALLDRMKRCRKEHAAVVIQHGNKYSYQVANDGEVTSEKSLKKDEPIKLISTFNYYYLLALNGFMSFVGNAFLPSIQSFSALPYGNVAFHWVVTLSTIASPVACFSAFFLPHHSIRQITVLTILSVALSIYATLTALMSPLPPMVNSDEGVILIIICWTLLIGINSYIRLSLTSILRFQGGKSLVLVGSVGQASSFVGAVLSFVLVNMTNLFKAVDRKVC